MAACAGAEPAELSSWPRSRSRLRHSANNNLRPTVAVVLVPAGPLGVAVMPAKCLLKLGTATRWAGLACPRLAHAILIN